MNRRMVRAYFASGTQYFSESANRGEGAMVDVTTMHPAHAANAARRLISECDFWAKEAGIESDAWVWMANTPLFTALVHRGMR